jgi:UDP-N-acetylmuramoyl-tripeptide--D-alanyl-D-alanine ligase
MAGFKLQDILDATGGRILKEGSDYFSGISIDSRTISDSELFIAIRGARFDGHDFIDEALGKGAGAIVSYPPPTPVNGKTIIHVNNSLKALQDLAAFQRKKGEIKVIGITGTNGKTTTKEMLCSIMKSSFSVLCSSGNLNNQIGLPLSLLKLEEEEMAVLEMGASKRGDIMELCEIAFPDIGVITNVGPGHLEGFGSIDTVRDTKLELAEYVKTVVINNDDVMLSPVVTSLLNNNTKTVLPYGIESDTAVMARNIRSADQPYTKVPAISFDLVIQGLGTVPVNMKVGGWFNVYNALAASAVSSILGIPLETIMKGLEQFEGVSMRLEIKELNDAVIISDVYNANPASMEEAVKELLRLREGRAIVVLGDMLELGSYAEEAHRKLGRWLTELPIDIFIATGPLMGLAADEFRNVSKEHDKEVYTVDDSAAARNIVKDISIKGDTILIKGSRGMNMERIMEANGAV